MHFGFKNNLLNHLKASTLHVSGLSQVVLLKLLKQWGEEGYKTHIKYKELLHMCACECVCKRAERWDCMREAVCGVCEREQSRAERKT